MEFFVFLLLVIFMAALAVMAFGGSDLAAGDDWSSEKTIHETGKETRAKMDATAQNHKQRSFDYLYSKHQKTIEEALRE